MTTKTITTYDLIIGLPIAAATGPDAPATTATIKANFAGAHTWTADDQPYSLVIDNVGVAAQPVGALFDYLLTMSGEMPPDRKMLFRSKEIGILGIGMNTVDLLVTQSGAPVESLTGSDTSGVRRLLELSNPGNLYTTAQLDDQLRAGTLDTTISLQVWQREVMNLIEATWGKYFKRFAAVICTGGGSILLRDALLKRFNGKSWAPDDPVMSTARGLYKYALSKPNAAATLAFDAGYGAIKLWGSRGGLLLQSAVATNGTRALGKVAGLKAVTRPPHITNALGSFYVGKGAHNFGRPVQGMDFDRLSGSPEIKALFHGALTQYLSLSNGRGQG